MVAQVNETRARVFLALKQFAEAERAIFVIGTFEKGEDASLLATTVVVSASRKMLPSIGLRT